MWKRPTVVLLGTTIAAVLFAVPLTTASAAPQALGLAAIPEPVPIHCEGGTCSFFLTAFCLQKKRPQPEDGVAYLPTESSEISLIVNTQAGKELTLPGRKYVEFFARNHTAVIAKIEQKKLAKYDVKSVAIRIDSLTSLVPEEQAGDLYPQSVEEISFATGPYRVAAENYLTRAPTPSVRLLQPC